MTTTSPSPLIANLIADSKKGLSLAESPIFNGAQLNTADQTAALTYVKQHADHSAYHLLMALRRLAPAAYGQVPVAQRAAVLVAALEKQTYLNDWGYLDLSDSYDGESAKALLDLGEAVQPVLIPVLADTHEAPLFGSEEATLSTMYKYRRNDFAYRYLMLISGQEPQFAKDPATRDSAIQALQQHLRATP